MAPNETETPEITFDEKTQIKSQKTVFDLDSKSDVTVVKIAPKRTVKTMEEFVTLLGNDADKILSIVNDGLEEYDRRELSKNPNVPSYQLEDDGTLTPFEGTTLSEEKSKQFGSAVLGLAKSLFGYQKKMDTDVKKNRELKSAAKESALNMLLSNPQAIELLKK